MRKLDFLFLFLLALFVLNFAVLDSLTTQIALSGGNCYESNSIIKHLNMGLVPAKAYGSLFIVTIAYLIYRNNKTFAIKSMIFFVGFSFGIVLNNILNILGGFS